MLIININIFLSTVIIPETLLCCLTPTTPILVEVFMGLEISSYMKDSIAATGTMTSPLCRSVFPLMYQYTMKCVLRTAVITTFISRHSSVKCSFSKPFFRMSLHFYTLCEKNETFKFIISSNST